jgi:hypothetical protein
MLEAVSKEVQSCRKSIKERILVNIKDLFSSMQVFSFLPFLPGSQLPEMPQSERLIRME